MKIATILQTVCVYCGRLVKEEIVEVDEELMGKVSHGCCKDCLDRELKKLGMEDC